MRGYLKSGDKNECFGCGACFQVCSKKAIKMELDREGFLYPIVDVKLCVFCNQCHKVCPWENVQELYQIEKTFVGFNTDSNIRRESASGGAFKSIVDVLSDEIIIFGVIWDGRSHAIHLQSSKAEAYERFHKSKYIQSDTQYTYKQAKELLANGKKVLYVGTPCQIAGLKAYLGKGNPGLLCVDLVCHGVPSGKVLENYLRAVDKKNDLVLQIDFRQKERRNGMINSKCALLHYSSGKKKIVDYDNSGFLRGFANGLFLRPSCSVCPFATSNRVSDLTIGDAWGVEKVKPKLNPHEGVSLILVNTKVGSKVMQDICSNGDCYTEIASEIVISGNGRLKKPDTGHAQRNAFFEYFENENFEQLVKQYIPRITKLRKIGHKIKTILGVLNI